MSGDPTESITLMRNFAMSRDPFVLPEQFRGGGVPFSGRCRYREAVEDCADRVIVRMSINPSALKRPTTSRYSASSRRWSTESALATRWATASASLRSSGSPPSATVDRFVRESDVATHHEVRVQLIRSLPDGPNVQNDDFPAAFAQGRVLPHGGLKF